MVSAQALRGKDLTGNYMMPDVQDEFEQKKGQLSQREQRVQALTRARWVWAMVLLIEVEVGIGIFLTTSWQDRNVEKPTRNFRNFLRIFYRIFASRVHIFCQVR